MARTAAIAALLLLTVVHATQADEESRSIFDGKDLSNWDGDPAVWSAEDGAIVGRTTAEKPIENNTFLIWKGGDVGDFRLQLEYKIEGGNSGVQYRSKMIDPEKWIVGGYQADIDSNNTYTGILYEERGRGILTKRGERVEIGADGKSQPTAVEDSADLQKVIRADDWNEYVIEASGPHLKHIINGKLMSETVDSDSGKSAKSGVLALQVHTGPPMTVRFRNIRLERLDK
jgi:hypothetical protein